MKIAAAAAQPGNPFSTVVATRTSHGFFNFRRQASRESTRRHGDSQGRDKAGNVGCSRAMGGVSAARRRRCVGSFAMTPLSATLQKMKVTIFFSGPQPSPQLPALVAPQFPALVGGAYRLSTGHIWTDPRP